VLGPRAAAAFDLEIDTDHNEDFFELLDLGQQRRVGIRGSSGVALASGLHWYLKHGCNISVAYGATPLNTTALPSVWPSVSACPISAGFNATIRTVRVVSPFRYRYYFNPVAHSYAAWSWDWARWQAEIDFMAMMGVNLPLATTGQEWVWARVWQERFNLTSAELAEHWPGPAFLAWGRMGNLRGWGGAYPAAGITGLTRHWMVQQRDLQRQIVARERALGMQTVLSGFGGHVPRALESRYPTANISRGTLWGGFTAQYSANSLLEATDPLFARIGRAFVEIQTEEFGSDHIYSADTFNEMQPRSFATEYVASWGSAVYEALRATDPEAVWLVQGWSVQFWPAEAVRSYWSTVPEGGLIVLDLDGAASSTSWQQWTNVSRPVISCVLDNFGGTRALEGPLGSVASQALRNQAAAPAGLITGIGWAPEDTHSNPIIWQMIGEAAWRGPQLAINDNDLSAWVDGWAMRRYYPQAGARTPAHAAELLVKAWRVLYRAAYGGGGPCTRCANCQRMPVCHDPACKPPQGTPPPPPAKPVGLVLGSDNYDKDGMARIPSLTLETFQSCNASGVAEAWGWLIRAADANPALASSAVPSFGYDLVDIGRQVLMDRFPEIYSPLVAACSSANASTISSTAAAHHRDQTHSSGSSFGGGGWGGAACASEMLGRNGSGAKILALSADLSRLLRTEPSHFGNRLKDWIRSARSFGGKDQKEQDWLEWNARMQITLWGTPAPALYDYASKQWGGLIGSYHLPQWRHFLQRMGNAAAAAAAANGSNSSSSNIISSRRRENPYVAVQRELIGMAEAWVNSTAPVAGVSGESPLEVSKMLFEKYVR
jgi:alpha-N-acetylglucosaminidase